MYYLLLLMYYFKVGDLLFDYENMEPFHIRAEIERNKPHTICLRSLIITQKTWLQETNTWLLLKIL